jgi:hypothetical protein
VLHLQDFKKRISKIQRVLESVICGKTVVGGEREDGSERRMTHSSTRKSS